MEETMIEVRSASDTADERPIHVSVAADRRDGETETTLRLERYLGILDR